LSRRALSRRVCEWLGWRGVNGKLKEVSCRKALLKLHRHGHIVLPAAERCFLQRARSEPPRDQPSRGPELCCALEELGEISIVPVSSRYSQASRTWNALLQRWHYLGKGPLCGAQIRYLIKSSRHGWVGALAFSAAQWRMRERDQYIGWSEAARRAHLHRVVGNSRFLILPRVHVRNLASRALRLCLTRLGKDWTDRYGYAPVLVETFVDPRRFAGTCYRAANWRPVGQTVARPTAYPNGKVTEGPKDIYLYPLCDSWKEVLCEEPEVELGSVPPAETPADWTEEEFGRAPFFDARLKQRLYQLAADFFAQPGELIPQASQGSAAKTKAAYRFFKNPQVDMPKLLRPHIESTLERIRSHPVILAVQDTTTLNYTGHPPQGVGSINNSQNSAVGLVLHDTMAFTPEGTPLGLLNVQCWARDLAQAGKKYRRHQLPIEEKESFKWLVSYRAIAEIQKLCPDTLLISVGDREADLYELFHEAAQDPPGPRLLVRAERTRNRRVGQGDEPEALWSRMKAQTIAGTLQVAVPRRGSRPSRTAKLEVCFASVVLTPPAKIKHLPLRVWAVYAREVDCPAEVKEPIDWMLLTTVKTESFREACQRLNWYSRRWGIEVYHRTLKSGCRIEDRRLEDTESLEACLAIDLVVAWRVHWLTRAGRETPNNACDQILKEEEWRVLSAWANGKMAEKVPSVQEATHWIGKMGGWLARGKQGHPGTTCIWRGLARLPTLVQGYLLALRVHDIRAGP
jgi:Druantia protein DruA/Transposase DNA-binding/Transposase Tn5 dimerisation domain